MVPQRGEEEDAPQHPHGLKTGEERQQVLGLDAEITGGHEEECELTVRLYVRHDGYQRKGNTRGTQTRQGASKILSTRRRRKKKKKKKKKET